MDLSQRERLYVRWGAVVLALALLWLLVLNPIRLRWREQRTAHAAALREFRETRRQARAKMKLDRAIAAIEQDLGARIPTGSPDEQISSLVKQVEECGKRNGAVLRNLTPTAGSRGTFGAAGKGGDKISFRLDFDTNQNGLVRFLRDLKTTQIPVVLESIDLRGETNQPDKLRVVLELYTYFFHG